MRPIIINRRHILDYYYNLFITLLSIFTGIIIIDIENFSLDKRDIGIGILLITYSISVILYVVLGITRIFTKKNRIR